MDHHHPLTVLTRLAARRPDQVQLLAKALAGRLEDLAEPAIDVAIETGDPIGQVMAKVIQEEAGMESAFAISERCNGMIFMPVPLREVALEATAKLLF